MVGGKIYTTPTISPSVLKMAIICRGIPGVITCWQQRKRGCTDTPEIPSDSVRIGGLSVGSSGNDFKGWCHRGFTLTWKIPNPLNMLSDHSRFPPPLGSLCLFVHIHSLYTIDSFMLLPRVFLHFPYILPALPHVLIYILHTLIVFSLPSRSPSLPSRFPLPPHLPNGHQT